MYVSLGVLNVNDDDDDDGIDDDDDDAIALAVRLSSGGTVVKCPASAKKKATISFLTLCDHLNFTKEESLGNIHTADCCLVSRSNGYKQVS